MNIAFQACICIIVLAYKFFLAKDNIWGWVLAIAASSLSLIYLLVYLPFPILICLEVSFLLLAIYGTYKHVHKHEAFTRIDATIIGTGIVVITSLVFVQIKTNTAWYEVVASAGFLVGAILIAMKSANLKIGGWILFIVGSCCIAKVLFDNDIYVLIFMHTISIGLCIYAIRNILKPKRQHIH